MARGEKFQFVGYYNCLDFVNTEFTEQGGRRIDSLQSFADLIDWLSESRLLNRAHLQNAPKLWGSGHAAERIFQDALALRKALLAMAKNLAARRPVPTASLQVINKTIGKCPARVLRARSSGRFEEMTRLDLHEPEQLMVPIAQSASDLLCHGDLALVKRCANPACGVFFYDTSKNHTRRWCSTTECGNRMRVAAHYRRYRGSARRISQHSS
jgi:predicted RNA-binding Zn ribbon-like protein